MATELDFADIKASLKTFLQGQEAFSDYDFEGSNLSALLNVLAYNTQLMALYWNMASNEYWIDSAQLRESLVSHAKSLNYIPRSRTSSRASLRVEIVPGDLPEKITIPRHYAFLSTIDGVELQFTTNNAIVILPTSNGYVANNITVYEGNIVTELFTNEASVDSASGLTTYTKRFILQSENIDQTSIEVSVLVDDSDTSYEAYQRYDNLFGITNETKAFFVQAYKANQYEVCFGNGVIGEALPDGAIVRVQYRDTLGALGNGVASFTKSIPIDGYASITATTLTRAYGGSERESDGSIAILAPRQYQTQQRAVTAYDYQTFVLTQFPQIRSCIAYGGEEIKKYGKVILSLRAYGTDGVVSETLKAQIIKFLSGKNLTTEPVIVDADVFNVEIVSNVVVDTRFVSDLAGIETTIIENLEAFNDSTLSEFGSDLRYSQVVRAIDNSNDYIVSSETTMRMIKKLFPTVNVSESHSIAFGNKIRSYGPPGIRSSEFTVLNADDEDVLCFLKDDGDGNIDLCIIGDDDENAVILQPNVGTVDYDTGDVAFTVTIKGYTNSVKVYAIVEGQDILVNRNQYIEINADDLRISCEALE